MQKKRRMKNILNNIKLFRKNYPFFKIIITNIFIIMNNYLFFI